MSAGLRVVPFVGRAGELGLLRAAFVEARAGRASVAMVSGEPGIGKTRIARELALLVEAQGGRVLWSVCYERDWSPPYAPWVEALGRLVRALDADALRAALGSDAAVLAELLPELGGVVPDLPAAPALAPEEARFRVLDALSRFLLALAEREPLLVVLDDLHWADRASLELLCYLGRLIAGSRPRSSCLLLLGAYRDLEVGVEHPLSDCLSELDRQGLCLRLVLKALPREEAQALVERLAEGTVAAELAAGILRATEGNPFFIGEVVRHLLEEGQSLAEGTPLGVPASVRQAVAGRLSRLAPESGRMLATAAAFSGPFDFATLEALSGLPEERLLACLDEALRAGMLRPAGGERYEFAHALVADALAAELSPSRGARLHRRIAQALERVHPGRASDAAELASQYYASASLPGAERGVGYALLAAEQAQAAHGQEQALEFLRMAKQLAADADASLHAEVACRLTLAQAEALRLEDAQRSAGEALAALAAAGAPAERVADFIRRASWMLQDAGAPQEVVLPLAERGLALLGGRRGLGWARLRLLERPVERIDAGPVIAGRWLGFDPEAVRIARARGEEEDYARTLDVMEWRTRAAAEELLARVDRWQKPVAKIHGLSVVLRILTLQHGALAAGQALAEQLLALSAEVGSIAGQAFAHAYLTEIQATRGELELAATSAARARELISRLGPGHRLADPVPWEEYAAGYWHGLDWSRFAALFRAAACDRRRPAWMGLVHAAIAAEAFARAGEAAEARRLLDWILPAIAGSEPTQLNQNGAVGFAGSAVWELADAERAPGLRAAALRLIEAGLGDFWWTSKELTVARMASLLGHGEQATEYFERARGALAESGQRPLRAVVDYDEALARARAGQPGASPLLLAARRRFEELGMSAYLERADAVAAGFPDRLTRRETEVLRLLAEGCTNRQLAGRLVLSENTVERHLANIYRKIGARNRAEATAYTLRLGL